MSSPARWFFWKRHTCDRKRSVVGLSATLLDFPPWLFFTAGLSGTWRSNLTLVSPTHRAKYLLNSHATCRHLNLQWHEERWSVLITSWQRLWTYGRSWFSSLLEIQILSTSWHEENDTVSEKQIARASWGFSWRYQRMLWELASYQGMLWVKLDTDSVDRKQSDRLYLQICVEGSLEEPHSQRAYEPPRGRQRLTFDTLIPVNRKYFGRALQMDSSLSPSMRIPMRVQTLVLPEYDP